jgi:spore germination cell wall hydrolase CwlJ-like protein
MNLDMRTLILAASVAVLAPATPSLASVTTTTGGPAAKEGEPGDGQPAASEAPGGEGDGSAKAAKQAEDGGEPSARGAETRAKADRGVDAELRCLALNIYHEARSESEKGQAAVAAVTLNRVESQSFPGSVCKVVKQGGEKRHRCQFSWWCDGRSDRPTDPAAWDKALELGRESLLGLRDDPTNGALYYHAVHVRPRWSRTFKRTARIGDHIFYRPAKSKSVKVASAEG